jgi:thymidylate synthase ThyX
VLTGVDMLSAEIVWPDADNEVAAPFGVEPARDNQMLGKWPDRLIELAGRACYNSYGKGRNSADYHTHVLDVGHLSLYEHPHVTVEWPEVPLRLITEVAACCAGRRGVRVRSYGMGMRLTVNWRAACEWDCWACPAPHLVPVSREVHSVLKQVVATTADFAGRGMEPPEEISEVSLRDWRALPQCDVTLDDEEQWASLHMVLDRGTGEEQLRHRARAACEVAEVTTEDLPDAVSKRSTRFCNESDSPWLPHPALLESQAALAAFNEAADFGRRKYDEIVSLLMEESRGKSLPPTDVRKQARGAARGVLGLALETRLVFSASIGQWKWQLHERMSDPADAQIRLLYGLVFDVLSARFADRFTGWATGPAGDGRGRVLTSYGRDGSRFANKMLAGR